MKLFLRLLWLIITQKFRSRCPVTGPVETWMRVYPNDLDLFMHVNNGVFFTYADLGRTDLLLRSDAFHRMRKLGWYPVVAAETMQFKRSLKIGQRFCMRTEVVGWSDKAIYLEQIFTHKQTLIAKALIDARFLKRSGGKVSHAELFELLGVDDRSPVYPEHLALWINSNERSSADSNKVIG